MAARSTKKKLRTRAKRKSGRKPRKKSPRKPHPKRPRKPHPKRPRKPHPKRPRKPHPKRPRPTAYAGEIGSGGHVRFAAPARGASLAGDPIAVTLTDVSILKLLSKDWEKGREGALVLSFNGQVSTVAWKFEPGKPVSIQRQLLYVGRPEGLVDVNIELVESDGGDRKVLAAIGEALRALSAMAFVPGYGAVAAAGFGLGSAIAEFARAAIDDDVELRLRGSIGDLGQPGGKRLPLRVGSYRASRRSDGAEEVGIGFSAHRFVPGTADANREVAILLDRVALELPDTGDDDVLMIDTVFTGGPQKKGSRPTSVAFSLKQELENRGEPIDRTLGIWGAVLYRGPWGRGIGFDLSVAAIARKPADEIRQLLDEAGRLARAVAGEYAEQVDTAVRAVETARAVVAKFSPEKRFAASCNGMLVAGASLVAEWKDAGFVVIRNPEAWSEAAIPVQIAGGGKAIFHVRVKNV